MTKSYPTDLFTEDMRNELLSSGLVEAIVKQVTLLNEKWLQYVHLSHPQQNSIG
jgi:hypothetical protein